MRKRNFWHKTATILTSLAIVFNSLLGVLFFPQEILAQVPGTPSDIIPPTISNLKIANPSYWGDGYNIYTNPNHLSPSSSLPVIGGNVNISADFTDDAILTNVFALLPGLGFFADSEFNPVPLNNHTWNPVPQGNYSVGWNTKNGANWRTVPDGNYNFTFEARDYGLAGSGGPQNSTTSVLAVTVDNTAPTTSFGPTTPIGGSYLRGMITVDADFGDENGLMNTYIGVHGVSWYCQASWPTVGLQTCSIDTTTIPDGSQKLTLSVRDKAGNTAQIFRDVVIDNTSPTVPGQMGWTNENPPTGSDYINGTDFAEYRTCGQSLNYSPMTNLWAPSTDDIGVVGYEREVYSPNESTLLAPSTVFTNFVNGAGVSNNTYWVRVRAFDQAGNYSPWSEKCSISYDTLPPSAPTLISPVNGLATNDTSPTLSWSQPTDNFDPNGINVRPNLNNYRVEVATNSDFITPERNYYLDNTYYSPSLWQANWYWRVMARDDAENWSSWSDTREFTIDTTPPLAPTPTSPFDGAVIRGVAFTQTWTLVTDAVLYGYESCNVDPGDVGDPCSSVKYTDTYAGTSKFVGAGQPDSHFWWRVKAKDTAGNWSLYGEAYELVIDNTPPVATWSSPAAGDTVIGAVDLTVDASDSLSGVEEVKFQYMKDGDVTFTDIATDSTDPYSTTWDTLPLPLGRYTIRAIVRDRAGNETVIDRTVYVAAVISNVDQVGISDTEVKITWLTDRPTSSRVVYDTASQPFDLLDPNYGYGNSTGESDTAPMVTNHTIIISGLGVGTQYFFRVVAKDVSVAVSPEYTTSTLSHAGPPPGGDTFLVSSSTAGVLGASTIASTSRYFTEYVEEVEADGEVLGDTPDEEPAESPTPEAGEEGNLDGSVLGTGLDLPMAIGIGSGVLLLLLILWLLFFRKKK